MDSLMDYIRILFHVDLVKMSTMIREAKNTSSSCESCMIR